MLLWSTSEAEHSQAFRGVCRVAEVVADCSVRRGDKEGRRFFFSGEQNDSDNHALHLIRPERELFSSAMKKKCALWSHLLLGIIKEMITSFITMTLPNVKAVF